MKYSYFDSITSRQCRPLTVAELMDAMRSPRIAATTKAIEAAMAEGNTQEADRQKRSLPVVVLNQLYALGQPRRKDGGKPTGLLMIDYDDAPTEETLQQMATHVTKRTLTDPTLKDCVVAAHFSARRHGIHIWYRWLDGCHTVEQCHERMATLLDMPQWDRGCKDNSRCSYLVPLDYFFIQNFGAMERNEDYARLQQQLTRAAETNPSTTTSPLNTPTHHVPHTDPTHPLAAPVAALAGQTDNAAAAPTGGAPHTALAADAPPRPAEYCGIPYATLVRELSRAAAPADKLDAEGNVLAGARDNTAFRLACLLRYVCDNNADWLYSLMPRWACALDDDQPGRLRQICQNACGRRMAFTQPQTLREVLTRLGGGDTTTDEADTSGVTQARAVAAACAEEETTAELERVPAELPPIISECVRSLPRAWQPAAAVGVLPMLGTILSRARAVYLDKRVHAPNVQVVIEAPFGSGKSNVTDFARLILAPLTEMDERGNVELNAYNDLVEKANSSAKLPDKPDVCVRKIAGDFTVAGFEQTLGTAKGLHMWCGTSEIDEVRRTWLAVSHILRKAYDNDLYGRSLQSSKSYKGERPIYFNTLLCGTPRAVARCYSDPEDGLVSRTIFYKLLSQEEAMPVSRMTEVVRGKLLRQVYTLHTRYCCGAEGVPVAEQIFQLPAVNKALRQWLREQYDLSVRTGNVARDCFRRRDAVNGFRAALIAQAIYTGLGYKPSKERTRVVVNFALWVASYSLRMHLLKFGDSMKVASVDETDLTRRDDDILTRFADTFTLAEAYNTLRGYKASSVRSVLSRLVRSGYLEQLERGVYQKKQTK